MPQTAEAARPGNLSLADVFNTSAVISFATSYRKWYFRGMQAMPAKSRSAEVFRSNVRAVMAERSMTIETLADMIGTSRPMMSNILSGKTGITLRRVDAIAAALDIPAVHLLGTVEKIPQVS